MKAQDLKNSILQLAIQGKLVGQREEEGTARELLKKIDAEKQALLKDGKIKKQKALPGITEDEIPFEIPESWEWVRLGNLCKKIGSGSTPKGGKSVYKEKGIKFLRSQNIYNDGLRMDGIVFISEEQNKAGSEVKAKDILLNITGGSIGRCALVPDDFDRANINQHVMIIRNIYPANRFYLHSVLIAPYIQEMIMSVQVGVSREGLSAEKLIKFLIPLPPIEEQKRIVAKIEALMPYIDQYDAAYSEVEALNKKFPEDLKKSILQYAIQGKLVKQRKEEGTAEALYQQIQAEKQKLIKEGKLKKTKALPAITEDEIPFDIPESWKWVRLGEIFEINPRNSVSDETRVAFIPMTLIEDGYRSEFTFEVRPWGQVKKGYTHFQNGDIVMAKITPCFQNLKSAIMMDLENGLGTGTTELHVLRPYCNSDVGFFLWFIKSPLFVATCITNMTGTAGQKRVPTDILRNYLTPLPPREEQKRIVKKIVELLPSMKQLEK
ncbi:Type I restriction modification DNA specificity domain protein [anaerobic digester metagenome]